MPVTKEKAKEYRIKFYSNPDNFEKYKKYFNEYNPVYYNNHKETLLKKLGEKVICNCGLEVRYDYLNKHKKTNKHEQRIRELNDKEELYL